MKPHHNFLIADEAEQVRATPPEVRLFRHIILNAVLDAIYGSCLTRDANKRIKAEALNWFREAGADFQRTCECAGLDPQMVQRDALTYIWRQRETLPPRATRPTIRGDAGKRAA